MFFGTDPQTGRPFVTQSIEGGGWGGRPFEDGASACVSICQGDVRNSPIENIELKVPLLVEERAYLPDSAGPGRFRGGLGIRVRLRSLAEGRWNLVQSKRRSFLPWGLHGGGTTNVPDNLIKRPDDAAFESIDEAHVVAPPDTVVIQTTSGGGGWGSPTERDPQLVLRDVIEGLVSAQAALRQYGVVLTADQTAIDEAATIAQRAAMNCCPTKREKVQ